MGYDLNHFQTVTHFNLDLGDPDQNSNPMEDHISCKTLPNNIIIFSY